MTDSTTLLGTGIRSSLRLMPPQSEAAARTAAPRGSGLGSAVGWTTAGRLASGLVQAAGFAFLVRSTTPAECGVAAAVLGALTVVATAGDLGTTGALVRVRARPEDRLSDREQRLVATNGRLSVLSGLLATLSLLALGSITGSRTLILLAPLGIWLIFDRLLEMIGLLALADGRSRFVASLMFHRRFGQVAVFIAAATLLPMPALWAYSSSAAISSACVWVWAWRRVDHRRGAASLSAMRASVRESLPFWWNSVGAQLRQFDVLVLACVTTPAITAIYAVPARLIAPMRILPTSLATAMLPTLVRSRGSIDARTRTVLKRSGLATVVLFVSVFLCAGPIMVLIGGSDYSGAETPLRILVLGLLFAAMTSSFGAVLQARGREYLVGKISIGTGIFSLISVALAGKVWGPAGAAWAVSTAFFVQFLLLVIASQRDESRSREVVRQCRRPT